MNDYDEILQVPEEISSKLTSCPAETAFRLMGQKYAVTILSEMILFKKQKFTDLLKSVHGINKKTLSIRLQEMEKGGIIEKKDL